MVQQELIQVTESGAFVWPWPTARGLVLTGGFGGGGGSGSGVTGTVDGQGGEGGVGAGAWFVFGDEMSTEVGPPQRCAMAAGRW